MADIGDETADEPLSGDDAKRSVVALLAQGALMVSRHAREEMARDGMTWAHCAEDLRGGHVDGVDCIGGTWRYRFVARRSAVVIAFRRGPGTAVVVTAWRFR